MKRLANISGRKAAKIFCRFGYRIARQTGTHIILKHPQKTPLVIPFRRSVRRVVVFKSFN